MRWVTLAGGPKAVGKAGLQEGHQGPGMLPHRVSLSYSRDDPGDQDLHQRLVIVTGQKLRLAGDFLQRLNDCTEFVDDDRILKREEVACLRKVFPLQHLLKKLVHGGSVC